MTTMEQERILNALEKIDSIMGELLPSLDDGHHKIFFDALDKAIQKQKRARDVLKKLREKKG
jgi:hypothetical protein